ncbi:MAG: Ku protein [Myxococcota bacterium]
MAARASSTAVISFGLVTVPVKLYAAASSKNVSFNMLHDKDKSRLKQQYVCQLCGEQVDRAHTVKGYEHAKDQYVVLSEEELKALEKKTDNSIEILEFVPIVSVDPVYFERSTLLGPDKGGAKAYSLLNQAMMQAGRVAVGRFATRGKEQLVLVRPTKDGLMLHALYYHDEVRGFEDVEKGEPAQVRDKELDLAVQLIEQLAVPAYKAEKYQDDYRTQVLEMIDKKVAGQEIVAQAPQQPKEQIIDLVEALKASLASKQGAPVVVATNDDEDRKPAVAKGSESGKKRAKAAKA